MKKLLAFSIFISITFLINGCGDQAVKSEWRTLNIKIDGNQLDWDNNVNYSPDLGTGLGLMNDSQNVYLCLNIKNPFAIDRILKSGFIVWLNSQQESDTIGVEFPVGSELNEPVKRRHGFERKKEDDSLKTKDTVTMHLRLTDLVKNQTKFYIINNNKAILHSYPVDSATSVQAAISYQAGQLVYELKFPLVKNNDIPYALNTAPGQTINIGFQIGGRIRYVNNEPNEGEGYGEPNESQEYGGYGYQPRQNVRRSSLSTWMKVALASDKKTK